MTDDTETSNSTSITEFKNEPCEKLGLGFEIWNKGLRLGKKMVIAGAAISSAPIVLPPLFIFSALGFTFALPFTLVFATYAFTQKMMNFFLPSSLEFPLLLKHGDDDKEDGKSEEQYENQLEEEIKDDEEKDRGKLEGEMKEEKSLDREEEESGIISVEGEMEEEKGMKREEDGSEIMEVVEVEKDDFEESRLSSEKGVFGIKDSSFNSVGTEGGVSVEQPVSSSGSVRSASELEVFGAPEEGFYNEGKIWEQIGVMRTIVGYKAALHVSYIEELKALYIFTGVEPPPSIKDSSDLAEVNNKLQFLKSVVGVR
ncbi:uncharacterized protein LOC143862352 [Tasmannia lanceolata]|uniref:uncharacterized protein LOC143862352 n=1 Tax=Tasmannia lanceolata TaxID=3420 RepID=UPI004064573B